MEGETRNGQPPNEGVGRSTIYLPVGDELDAGLQRACLRSALEFFTLYIERVIKIGDGDVLDGIILTSILHWNITAHQEGLAKGQQLTRPPIPDELRRPVSVYMLSKRLSLPYETTRRHVTRLVERGFCSRAGRAGVFVTRETIGGLVVGEDVQAIVGDLARLVSQLDSVKALAHRPDAGP